LPYVKLLFSGITVVGLLIVASNSLVVAGAPLVDATGVAIFNLSVDAMELLLSPLLFPDKR
jgi:hypothetical protein